MALTIKIPYRAFWWALAIVVGLFILFILPLSLTSHGMWGGHDARRTANLSNLKQVNNAMGMYQADNDGRFPPKMSTTEHLKSALLEYAEGNEMIFGTLNELGGEFRGNERLAGRDGRLVTDPDRAVSLYDSEEWKDSGLRNCGFVDGHVKYIDGFNYGWGLKVEFDEPSGS